MDVLTLIMHLRRRHFQMQEEWVKMAGACYLSARGYTFDDAPNLIPMAIFPNPAMEMEMREAEVENMKQRMDELEAEIQKIGRRNA